MDQQEALLHEQKNRPKLLLGFWLYLMTDCLLFATLFAAYAVLQIGTANGPAAKDIFDPWFVLGETLVLLVSSFTCGLALLAMQGRQKQQVMLWLGATVVLGLAFLGMELFEFISLAQEGHGWERSGFLSAFFTLVGTHGLHITVGILWAIVMILRVNKYGLTPPTTRKVTMFGMFWHFLDVIWIFIFTIVYMLGVL